MSGLFRGMIFQSPGSARSFRYGGVASARPILYQGTLNAGQSLEIWPFIACLRPGRVFNATRSTDTCSDTVSGKAILPPLSSASGPWVLTRGY
jgi:hypothetical protein